MSAKKSIEKRPGLLRRMWNRNLLGDLLDLYTKFLTIFIILFYFTIVGLLLYQRINPRAIMMAMLIVSIVLLFVYALLRFFPDLLRIFVHIEHNSRPNDLRRPPGRYVFLGACHWVFRVLAIIVFINVFFGLIALATGGYGVFYNLFKSIMGFVHPWITNPLLTLLKMLDIRINNSVLLLILVGISVLVGVFFLLVSDAAGLFINIERNFRHGNNKPPTRSIHLSVFNFFKYLTMGLLVVYALLIISTYYMIDWARNQNQIAPYLLWQFVPTNLSPSQVIFNVGMLIFTLGVFGDLVSVFFHWAANTRRDKEREPAGFFALRNLVRLNYLIAALSSALILVIGGLFAVRGMGVLSFIIISLMAGLVFVLLTFISAIAKSVMKIEANLRPATGEQYPSTGFFGVKFIARLLKILAVLGTVGCTIVALAGLALGLSLKTETALLSLLFIPVPFIFYIVTAAFPDFLKCLLRIETYVRHASSSSLPEQTTVMPSPSDASTEGI